ncbi:MAG: HDOD domain-containing protein [Acidimicrobiales bacterium]|nr:HDOD domain-containing protein [Acidimicrobiales bacterium]
MTGIDVRPTVVFVDDDRDVLDGLRRSLRPERKRWELEFVASAEDALDVVSRRLVDVIVTDMRMPHYDGARLLEELRKDHPGIVRIVLSGEANAAQVSRTLPTVHRWLAKPCDRAELVGAIDDALAARGSGNDTALLEALGGVSSLPSPPTVYADLVALTANDQVGHGQVAHLVESDPAIAARLLQWARSPFIGLDDRATVTDVVRSVGHRAVVDLVLSVEVLERMTPEAEIPGLPSEALRCHGELTGRMAVHLARRADEPRCRTAGLLHEVGLLVAATRLHDPLVAAIELARTGAMTLDEAERTTLGHTHADIGALLLSLWGLPASVAALVGAQHRAHVDPTTVQQPADAAVRVASWLTMTDLAGRGKVDPVFVDGGLCSSNTPEPVWLPPAQAALDALLASPDAPDCTTT